MKNFSRNLISYLASSALGLSFLVAGCNQVKVEPKKEETEAKFSTNYSFNSFQDSLQFRDHLNHTDITALASGDFDGDGDIDLAVGIHGGLLYFYENKMPQKSKLEE